MTQITKTLTLVLLGGSFVVGCAGSEEPAKDNETTANSQPDPAYLMTEKPANAEDVGAARKNVKDDEEVMLTGRIGGSGKPFVDGLAAFTIVDLSVKHCAPEENCPTPWDYCCMQNEVKDNIATVKVVNASGQIVDKGAKQLLGAKELDQVIVKGKAKRDDAGNLTVLAEKVFVERGASQESRAKSQEPEGD